MIAASALIAAGCASASSGAQVGVGAVTGLQTAHTETASEVANQLLDIAQVPPDAVRTDRPANPSLAQPPDEQVASGLVVRIHWWRVNQAWTSVYAWVARHQSDTLASMGSSSSGGPALNDQEQSADFGLKHLPATINTALLSVAVAPLPGGASAIGAYALVIPQPPRPAVEDVPLSVHSVTVITRRTTGTPDSGQILGRRTLTGAAARQLITDFDAMTVQPAGEQFGCPMSFITQTALFRSGSRLWQATSGVCIGVGVTLDGHQLPTLNSSNAFTHDLRAAYGRPFPGALGPQPMAGATTQSSTASH